MEGACPLMKKQKVRRPLYWLMPLLFALPFALGGLYVFQQYAPKLTSLMEVAMKLVVIP